MDCKAAHPDNSSKYEIDKRNYKHYELMMQMALSKGDPVVLEWIRNAWRVVEE